MKTLFDYYENKNKHEKEKKSLGHPVLPGGLPPKY